MTGLARMSTDYGVLRQSIDEGDNTEQHYCALFARQQPGNIHDGDCRLATRLQFANERSPLPQSIALRKRCNAVRPTQQ